MKVVYNSFAGRYRDNPRAIYEALDARHDPTTHVWLADPARAHEFPATTATVALGSAECVGALETADVVVSNTHIEFDWVKRPGASYLQTWHGTPLKHIHMDSLWASPATVHLHNQDVRRWDVLLSPNVASTVVLRTAFGF